MRLTVAGRTWRRPLRLLRDPRVRASDADLIAQAAVALPLDALLGAANASLARRRNASAANLAPLEAVARSLEALENAIESADAAPTSDQAAAARKIVVDAKRLLR